MNDKPRIFLTGASSGIGFETARLLALGGGSVWGTSRDAKRLPSLENFHPVAMDLADMDSVRKNFSTALAEAGRFDVLINNAGEGVFGAMESQPDELVREQFQVLFHAPLELIRLALPGMRERNDGRIINVTSLAARFPVPYLGAYNAAKAAMVSLSHSLRLELARTNVRVIDIQPGNINTGFQRAARRIKSERDRERIQSTLQHIDKDMAAAPHPKIVAQAIMRLIHQADPPPVVTVGSFFQARLGPLLARFGSTRMVEAFLRRYYRL